MPLQDIFGLKYQGINLNPNNFGKFFSRNSTAEIVEDSGIMKKILPNYIWFESAIQKLNTDSKKLENMKAESTLLDSKKTWSKSAFQKLNNEGKKMQNMKKENILLDSKKPLSNPLEPKSQQFNNFILRHSW